MTAPDKPAARLRCATCGAEVTTTPETDVAAWAAQHHHDGKGRVEVWEDGRRRATFRPPRPTRH